MPGLHDVYNTKLKKIVSVKHNIVTGTTQRYILLEKDMFGKNKPCTDFYVTSGHVLVINGVEIKARDIPNAKRVKVKPEMVYLICTEDRQPINHNGLCVHGTKNNGINMLMVKKLYDMII